MFQLSFAKRAISLLNPMLSRLGLACAIAWFINSTPGFAGCQDLVIGVNDTTLSWRSGEDRRRSTVDIASAGVLHLRLGLLVPLERVARIVRDANEKDVKILIDIPLGLPALYPSSIRPRPGNSVFRAVRPLSQLDLNQFATVWKMHRDQLRSMGAKVFAYEIGNEINNPGFNGDFPVAPQGRVMPLADCDLGETCAAIEAGLRKYVDVVRFVRQQGGLDGELVIAGGLSDPKPSNPATAGWLARSGGVFAPARDVIQRLEDLGAGKYVDAYAIHLYPPPDLKSFDGYIADAMADCRLSGKTGKSCWVTEWGIRSSTASCQPDPERNRRLVGFVRALRGWASKGLAAAFYYDWDQNPKLSVFRCGHWVADPAVAVPSAFCGQ